MNVKQKIKDSKGVLVGFLVGGLVFGTISYGAGSSGLLGEMLKLDNGVLKFKDVDLALDNNSLSGAKLENASVDSIKLSTSLNTTINSKADSGSVNTALATKLDKNTAITAGTATKVTYDTDGLVTSSTGLIATDIPDINAEKITSGVMLGDRVSGGTLQGNVNVANQGAGSSSLIANTKFVTDAINANNSLSAASSKGMAFSFTAKCSILPNCPNISGRNLTTSSNLEVVHPGPHTGWWHGEERLTLTLFSGGNCTRLCVYD